ncbi:MAG: MAPEG family protein [Aestuariivirgaceae bacterium]
MTSEIYWLLMTIGLCLLIWIPYTALYAGVAGLKAGTTNIPPVGELPDWAQRCHRAHMNLIEVLLPFGLLVLIIATTGKADSGTATAAAIFFFARVAHAVIYTMGIPFLRTPAFAASWLVCIYLLWKALS